MMRLNATLPAMTITREVIVGLAYLAAYVLLDRVSLYESYAPLGTTPWNPSIGLSFVLILVFGRQFVALLFIAPLLADIANRHDSLVWPTEILSVVAIGTSYSAAAAGILSTQIGVILGVALFPDTRDELVALQCLMLVLTATGLVAGALVTERQRVESQLQLHRDSLARLAQFGSMAELAAAMAHEVNQPLMAAGTYARLVADAMSSSSGEATEVRELAHRTVAQINRAGEVIRRLRAMLRLDRSNRTAVPFVQIVTNTIALCEQDLKQSGVDVCVDIARGAPSVLVDILQIEQVLLNLIRNSIDAIRHNAQVGGTIVIEARRADDAFIEASITDSGPGFSREYLESGILSLSSSRAKGLGIGLPLSRSIIEAHRGRLWLDAASQRASVHFTLPIA
jgi:two-component system, LuxR family, sensor kinase FixL